MIQIYNDQITMQELGRQMGLILISSDIVKLAECCWQLSLCQTFTREWKPQETDFYMKKLINFVAK